MKKKTRSIGFDNLFCYKSHGTTLALLLSRVDMLDIFSQSISPLAEHPDVIDEISFNQIFLGCKIGFADSKRGSNFFSAEPEGGKYTVSNF